MAEWLKGRRVTDNGRAWEWEVGEEQGERTGVRTESGIGQGKLEGG